MKLYLFSLLVLAIGLTGLTQDTVNAQCPTSGCSTQECVTPCCTKKVCEPKVEVAKVVTHPYGIAHEDHCRTKTRLCCKPGCADECNPGCGTDPCVKCGRSYNKTYLVIKTRRCEKLVTKCHPVEVCHTPVCSAPCTVTPCAPPCQPSAPVVQPGIIVIPTGPVVMPIGK